MAISIRYNLKQISLARHLPELYYILETNHRIIGPFTITYSRSFQTLTMPMYKHLLSVSDAVKP